MQSLDCHENTRKFTYEYLSALDCPRSLTVFILFEQGEHKQLSELQWDPHHYNDLKSARDSLAATKFLSKAVFLRTGNQLKEIAMEKFFETELQCKKTNEYLVNLANKPDLASSLLAAQFKISSILSDFTPDEFIDACNFGPGSTTTIRRRLANHPYKFQFETGITQEAYDFTMPWFSNAYPLWEVQPKVISGSKIVTVPKNAKTDRVIAIEPGINLWFQKGIGSMLRRRLKGFGIDLNNQSINGDKSRIASKFSHLATVDFSSASDTISTKLVEEIFPQNWLALLRAYRSKFATVDGKIHRLEKFSSMGNGFTFELESLIFYVFACVACDRTNCSSKEVSVYGDDVILPVEAYDEYCSIVQSVGFTVNLAKSYSSSYYRESCGAHYWDGQCVKPIFLKEELYEEDTILRNANSVREYSRRRVNGGCDRTLRRCWVFLAALLGSSTPRICSGYGDIGLIVNEDEAGVNPVPAKHGIEGNFHLVWCFVPITRSFSDRGLLLFKLKTLGRSRDEWRFNPLDITEAGCVGNEVPMPMQVKKTRKRVLVPRWTSLGPWI